MFRNKTFELIKFCEKSRIPFVLTIASQEAKLNDINIGISQTLGYTQNLLIRKGTINYSASISQCTIKQFNVSHYYQLSNVLKFSNHLCKFEFLRFININAFNIIQNLNIWI